MYPILVSTFLTTWSWRKSHKIVLFFVCFDEFRLCGCVRVLCGVTAEALPCLHSRDGCSEGIGSVGDWSSAAGPLRLGACGFASFHAQWRCCDVISRWSVSPIDSTWWLRKGLKCPFLSPVGIVCSRVCNQLLLVVVPWSTLVICFGRCLYGDSPVARCKIAPLSR